MDRKIIVAKGVGQSTGFAISALSYAEIWDMQNIHAVMAQLETVIGTEGTFVDRLDKVSDFSHVGHEVPSGEY